MNSQRTAFPIVLSNDHSDGFSKREYAAIKILSGLVAGYDPESKVNGRFIPNTDHQMLCTSAIQLADECFKLLDLPNEDFKKL